MRLASCVGVLLLCAIIVHVQGDVARVVLEWTGGTETCNDGCSGNSFDITRYNRSYACNDGQLQHGNWSDMVMFQDPLPANAVLAQVGVVMNGSFNCLDQANGSTLFVTLQGTRINENGNMPSSPAACNCPNCQVTVASYSPTFTTGWPAYAFGQSNEVALDIQTNEICLSTVELYLYYATVPVMRGLEPRTGPTTGQTVVAVYGSNFTDLVPLYCHFGEQTVKAAVMSSELVYCEPSPSLQQSPSLPYTVPFAVDFSNTSSVNNTTAKYQFTYYEEVLVQGLDPQQGPTDGGTQITVYGQNFQDFGYLVCLFDDAVLPGEYVDYNTVVCTSPAMVNDTSITTIQVSLNGQQAGDSYVVFRYTDSSGHGPNVTWIVLGTLIGCAVLAVTAMILVKKIRRMRATSTTHYASSNRLSSAQYQPL